MNSRRELTVAVAGCALGGALALATGGQTWASATVDRPPPLPPVPEALSGTALVPLVPAAGLLLLATAVAVIAVRGRFRQAVGVLAVLAGGALIWSALRPLVTDLGPGDLPDGAGAGATGIAVAWHPAWPVVAGIGGFVALAAGVLVAVRGSSWVGLGRRYERLPESVGGAPAGTDSPADRSLDAWRALDRGEDPTVDDDAGMAR